MSTTIPTALVPSVAPEETSARRVRAELERRLEAGARLRVDGEAKTEPDLVLDAYPPAHVVQLFDTRFYLSRTFQNPALRFFVAYVAQGDRVHARIFYKDVSLIWRVASHMISTPEEFWIGKGAVREIPDGDHVIEHSDESTTDLPLEMQTAMETVTRQTKRVGTDAEALYLVLRSAPAGRIAPYRDFDAPRERAAQNPKNLVHRGGAIARFTRRNDPTSLRIVKGYEPDFARGVVERSTSHSRIYGGTLRRFRIASTNRRIQYLFVSGPKHTWIIPPQATTTELSSYGVRTVDVHADEDLFVPGYEYHYFGEHGDEAFSQIPEGFAGAPSEHDPERADASAWLDQLPVVRQFRRALSRGAS